MKKCVMAVVAVSVLFVLLSCATATVRKVETKPAGEGVRPAGAIDQLSDLNRDGVVSAQEKEIREQSLKGPHPVANEFDRRIDFNGNRKVEDFEIERVLRMGRIAGARVAAEGLPARTLADRLFDLNGDGKVSGEEINAVVAYFLQGPHPVKKGAKLDGAFDFNGNGQVEPREMMTARERFLRPHPVVKNAPADAQLDANKDGFVGPEEIGIAAGHSPGNEVVPFEDLIAEARLRQGGRAAAGPAAVAEKKDAVAAKTEAPAAEEAEDDYQKRLGELADKKVALVDIGSTSKSIDEETVAVVMVFIENAFVNTGKISVVERKNIDKVIKEHEFQASDLVTEGTAVQVGKFAGAQIIGIGTLSYVGSRYYLNVKLIDVESGEIIGSSIAEVAEAKDFLKMANEAAFKLFQ